MSAPPTGILFNDPRDKPTSTAGAFQPGCYRFFYTTQTTTQSPVYSDGGLTVPLPQPVTAGADGRFPQIYLVPNTIYRCQLFNAANVLLDDTDPYVSGGGLGLLSATIGPPATGGVETLTVLGSANAATLEVTASSTSGQSLGVLVEAGTTAADYAVLVQNQATTNTFLEIFGDGHGTLGPTSALGLSWNTAGNVVVAAPSSGTALSATAASGATISIQGNNNGASAGEIVSASSTAGDAQFRTFALGVTNWAFGTVRSSGNFALANSTTLASPILTITQAGNATINAPTSGSTLTLTTLAGGQILSGTDGTITATMTFASSELNFGTGNANTLALVTGGTSRLSINSAGAATINTPSSGTTLTLNVVNNITGFLVTDGTSNLAQQTDTSHTQYFGTTTTHALNLITNSATRIAIASAGNVTINAPVSGTSLTVNGNPTSVNLVTSAVRGNGSTALVFTDPTGQKGYVGYGDTNDDIFFVTQGLNNTLRFQTNNIARVDLDANGHLTIAAPTTSGIGVKASGNSDGNAVFLAHDDQTGFGYENTAATRVLTIATVKGWTGAGVNVTDAALGTRALFNLYAQNSATATMQLSSSAIQGLGPTAAALVDMTPDKGTFNGTGTGFTVGTTPTFACIWARMGNVIVLNIGSATGTSNATTFTMTGLPAAIQPAHTQACALGWTEDSSAISVNPTAAQVTNSGTVTFYNQGNSSGWTASGTKGFNAAQTITYLLN